MPEHLALAKSSIPFITIREHTNLLIKCLDNFIKLYPNFLSDKDKMILRYAAELHDIGKYSIKFQNKLYKRLNLDLLEDPIPGYIEIPHEVLSLLAVNEDILDRDGYRNDDKIILYNCIGFSHVRDFFNIGPDEENYLKEICRLDLNQNLQLVQKDFPCVKEFKYTNKIRKYFGLNNIHRMYNTNKDLFYRYIKIKGLLNRLDYAASAMFDSIEISPKDDKTGLYLYEIIKKAYPQLRDIQNFMYNNSDKNLVVIGSTGIGKTEACCLWMKEDKMFYTLPLKVAINAIYERLSIEDPRGYDYGYGYKKATLIHSDMIGYYMNLIKNKDDLYVKITEAKQFQSPLSVSTVDQLFTFVFKYQGFEVPLSTLAYSKVVIDELQMYDAEIVAYLLYGLKMITDMGGKFSIVTATLPKIFTIFLEDLKIPFTQAPKVYKRLKSDGSDFLQHRIMLEDYFNIDEIIKEGKLKKVLVVVNTVQKAQELYEKISNRINLTGEKIEIIRILHKRYINKHRKELEKDILSFAHKKRLDNRPGIWICTQIVEASLDVDFDVLYTELCSIDSLLQRFGRVFRHREYTESLPNIHICMKEVSGVVNGDISREIMYYTKKSLEKFFISKNTGNGVLLTEEDKQYLIDYVYDPSLNKAILKSEYYKTIENRLNYLKGIMPYFIDKNEAKEMFRNIFNYNAIPREIYDTLIKDGTIERWKKDIQNGRKLEVIEEIKDYIVPLPEKAMKKGLLIEFPNKNEFKHSLDDVYICTAHYYYDEEEHTGQGLVID